jgi:hypothetical protein
MIRAFVAIGHAHSGVIGEAPLAALAAPPQPHRRPPMITAAAATATPERRTMGLDSLKVHLADSPIVGERIAGQQSGAAGGEIEAASQ